MLKKALDFLNLLDSEHRLSITSLAMYVVLTKVAVAPSPSLTDLGSLLLVLLNYAHKRIVVSSAVAEEGGKIQVFSEVERTVEELKSKVNAMAIKAGFQSK